MFPIPPLMPQLSTTQTPIRRRRLAGALVIVTGLLGGCATYSALPLADKPDLARTLPALEADVTSLHLPGIHAEVFDPADGLDAVEVAELAVIDSPDLKAMRMRAGVAHAQAFAAGLLPDPQLGLSFDRLKSSGPGLVNGRATSLDYPLDALIAHADTHAAATADARAVDLGVLWAEWQTGARARVLFAETVAARDRVKLLSAADAIYGARAKALRRAVARGDLSGQTVAAGVAAAAAQHARLAEARQTLAADEAALHALLGLDPDIALKLQPAGGDTVPPDGTEIAAALRVLPARRPDLRALQAGYASQEARVRAAILAQFPVISVGVNRASDTSAVVTNGLSISLDLPLFSGARGAIAEVRSTRAQLHAEYQARLDAATAEIRQLHQLGDLLEVQQQQLQTDMPAVTHSLAAAHSAYTRGAMSATDYLALANYALDRRIEAIDLALQLRKTTIALQTLLGLPIPTDSRKGENKP